jgi:hypothetical protein
MTEEESPPPTRSSYRPMDSVKRLGVTFIVLGVIWLVLKYAGPSLVGGSAAPPAPAVQRIETLPAPSSAPDTARIDALEARIKALEERPTQAAPVADARVSDLSEQLSSQQGAVADLKKSIDDGNRHLAALTLFGQLKEAVLHGDSYRRELHEFTALMQGQDAFVPLLAKLTPAAENGLPTVSTLQNEFAEAMNKALSPKSDTWSATMHTLIRVRKVGAEQKGGDDEAVLARAEAKLQAGDVALALKELEPLSPPAAEAMAAWKKQAASYVDAKEALNALQVALFKPAVTTP